MNEKKWLNVVAESANAYNLQPLLELVCAVSAPDAIRRDLMQCYFLLSDYLVHELKQSGTDSFNKLTALRLVIGALDKTLETAEPPLRVEVI